MAKKKESQLIFPGDTKAKIAEFNWRYSHSGQKPQTTPKNPERKSIGDVFTSESKTRIFKAQYFKNVGKPR